MESQKCKSILGHSFRAACLIGFLTQVTMFLRLYMTYPTRTEIRVFIDDSPQVPPLTICNNNRFRKHFFNKSEDQIAEMYYNDSVYNEYIIKTDASFIIMVGNNFNSSIRHCKPENRCRSENAYPFYYYEFGTCFIMNSNITGRLERTTNVASNFTMVRFSVILNGNEYPEISDVSRTKAKNWKPPELGAVALTHDPQNIPRFITNRYTVAPGKLLEIFFAKREMEYLGEPYFPYCTNYEEDWLSQGKRGYLTRDTCIMDCMDNFFFEQNHCFPVIDISDPIRLEWLNKKCSTSKVNFPTDKFFRHCNEKCKVQCRTIEFDVHVVSSDMYGTRRHGRPPGPPNWGPGPPPLPPQDRNPLEPVEEDPSEENTRSDIKLTYNTLEVNVYSLKPQYQNIEIFSYLGGYMGMWLGASILSLPHYIFIISAALVGKKINITRTNYSKTPIKTIKSSVL